ncbi:hypothetical protein BJP36_43725 [Moorena producens JHB]|uniref:Uncharacterized protein n=1 Tax=Moorena producens (strain JHB) TaxID=1454205 RepID=A0A9Q9UVX0_MOOP1|nr:hypothetical protein [Moorena producens]WAN69273.1 hypothetical protein BJP36_43725 [Moorena producens JHB]
MAFRPRYANAIPPGQIETLPLLPLDTIEPRMRWPFGHATRTHYVTIALPIKRTLIKAAKAVV